MAKSYYKSKAVRFAEAKAAVEQQLAWLQTISANKAELTTLLAAYDTIALEKHALEVKHHNLRDKIDAILNDEPQDPEDIADALERDQNWYVEYEQRMQLPLADRLHQDRSTFTQWW